MSNDLRPIPGYEGVYAVTADGRIWSHAKAGGRRHGFAHSGMWLKPVANNNGYLGVILVRDRRKSHMLVHRAVALAWVANPRNLPHVNHLDGVKTHNVATNLEWCTQAENVQHGYDIGLRQESAKQRRAARETGRNNRKLTLADAASIRSRRTAGERVKDLAAAFGVDRHIISRITGNKAYINERERTDAQV